MTKEQLKEYIETLKEKQERFKNEIDENSPIDVAFYRGYLKAIDLVIEDLEQYL